MSEKDGHAAITRPPDLDAVPLAVQEPDVRTIITSNAGLNEHMVAINEAMGFEISDRFGTWRLDLSRG